MMGTQTAPQFSDVRGTWDMDIERVNEVVKSVKDEGRYRLLESESREVLKAAGIPTAEGKVVRNLPACIEAAEEIGYPVVLKVDSEDIVHKMDVGGVVIGIEDEEEVKEAYQALHSRVRARKADANIRGISVSEMIEGGKEVVIGGMVDPTFGPVVMFGLGGIYVEIFEDVEFRVAPLDLDESHEMISDIDSFPLLVGARGQRCRDLEALAEIISKVGYLVCRVDEINELELNPVAALERGAKALDVAITLK
ncbi:MAG: acetate--CoA ligase family protein [Candidatus Thermoplasmatota archaeon]